MVRVPVPFFSNPAAYVRLDVYASSTLLPSSSMVVSPLPSTVMGAVTSLDFFWIFTSLSRMFSTLFRQLLTTLIQLEDAADVGAAGL